MSTPTPILTPEQRAAYEQNQRWRTIGRNVAIGGVIICPIIALLPPRKLDLYTFALGTCTYLSADHLSYEYKGQPLLQNFAPTWNIALPTEKARENQERLRQGEQALREGRQVQPEKRGFLTKLWMGDEGDDWKEKRMAEERKAQEEGRGIGDMIIDQIWEVWNWDKKRDGSGDGNASPANPTNNDEKK